MILLSKELLSEVLNIENERISKRVDRFCFPSDNIIAIAYYMEDGWQHLNIHQLATKCKEWAMQLYPSYIIDSGIGRDLNFQAKTDKEVKLALQGIVQGLYGYSEIIVDRKKFTANTEPEAIFKACQWILDNKDRK